MFFSRSFLPKISSDNLQIFLHISATQHECLSFPFGQHFFSDVFGSHGICAQHRLPCCFGFISGKLSPQHVVGFPYFPIPFLTQWSLYFQTPLFRPVWYLTSQLFSHLLNSSAIFLSHSQICRAQVSSGFRHLIDFSPVSLLVINWNRYFVCSPTHSAPVPPKTPFPNLAHS